MKWISLKVKKPRKGDTVLVWCRGLEDTRIADYNNSAYGDKKKGFHEIMTGHDIDPLVTHWQPMPSPPRQ